ncbi:MAG: c-type cytochrome [Candidatus Accumulibacter sp.]|uniref:c-type cytochrome n=1 Tax=Accumulibacter sp. TaxID=2053492 RepID=UPI002878B7BF|nr:c-type cytochrome [Accumulibacter sp.]MDS4015265.1 c-type cytochrome [Accumulibacter sp.]
MSLLRSAHRARCVLLALLAVAGGSLATAGERPLKGGPIKPEVIYHNYCSVCHGDRGDGNSRAKGSLVPPPRDFTKAAELTRSTMITIVTHGKEGTAMTGWTTQLNAKEIEAVVDYIRSTFMVVALDPRLQKGRSLYAHNCVACHGDRGQGAPIATGVVPPRDFSSPQSRAELTRERMIQSVTHGRPNTSMAAFGGRLQADDIGAIVDYIRAALMVPETRGISGTDAHAGRRGAANRDDGMSQPFQSTLKPNVTAGRKLYMATCATCHGENGDGKGPRAYFIRPKPRNFLDPGFRSTFNRPALYTAVAEGRLGTEMPAWNKVLTEQEMVDVSEFVFTRFVRPAASRAGTATKDK